MHGSEASAAYPAEVPLKPALCAWPAKRVTEHVDAASASASTFASTYEASRPPSTASTSTARTSAPPESGPCAASESEASGAGEASPGPPSSAPAASSEGTPLSRLSSTDPTAMWQLTAMNERSAESSEARRVFMPLRATTGHERLA
jgi:hypothetical protein